MAKNRYVVQFNTVSGKTLFIRHYGDGINAVTTCENKCFIFTNKKTASDAAKYFVKYVLSEYAETKIYTFV